MPCEDVPRGDYVCKFIEVAMPNRGREVIIGPNNACPLCVVSWESARQCWFLLLIRCIQALENERNSRCGANGVNGTSHEVDDVIKKEEDKD